MDEWREIWATRTPEFWGALIAGMLYVYKTSEAPTRGKRVVDVAISGFLGYSVSDAISNFTGFPPSVVVALTTGVGYLAFDVARAIMSDPQALKDFLLRRKK